MADIRKLPSKSIQRVACSGENLGTATLLGQLEVDSSYDDIANMQEPLDVDLIAYLSVSVSSQTRMGVEIMPYPGEDRNS